MAQSDLFFVAPRRAEHDAGVPVLRRERPIEIAIVK
jgi:hypothetical protein